MEKRPIEKKQMPKRVMRWPSDAELKGPRERYRASRMHMLEQNAAAVKELISWRNSLGIEPNSNADRAAAFIIRSMQAKYPNTWQGKLASVPKRQKAIGGNVPLRIASIAESIYVKSLENKLRGAQPGREKEELARELAQRKGFLGRYRAHLKSKTSTQTVGYGDAQVPEWYNMSMPSNPLFREFAKKHGIRYE